jgi:hypothetical protein
LAWGWGERRGMIGLGGGLRGGMFGFGYEKLRGMFGFVWFLKNCGNFGQKAFMTKLKGKCLIGLQNLTFLCKFNL